MAGYVSNPGVWTAAIVIVVAVSIWLANYVGSPLLIGGTLSTLLFVGIASRSSRQTV